MSSTVSVVLSSTTKFGAACFRGPQCGQSIQRSKSTISLGRFGLAMISKWAGTALLPQLSHVMFLGRNMASTLSIACYNRAPKRNYICRKSETSKRQYVKLAFIPDGSPKAGEFLYAHEETRHQIG